MKNKASKNKRNQTRSQEETTFAGEINGAEVENTEKYHFFYKSGSPFSQWHNSAYSLDGYQLANAEQGMMLGKALLFEDEDVVKEILSTTDPRKIKALGRKVKGFNYNVWKKHRERIVYRNNVAKFSQNPHLREALLNTSGLLVEASPSDKIWGIGLNEKNAKKLPESQWKGKNLLGRILTRVREEISESMEADMEKTEKYHFFWKAGSPFSQWHQSAYSLDGYQLANAEQGMMLGKALLFEDDKVAREILLTTSPRRIKALGKQVKGFNEKVWKKNREKIVYRNNMAKFSQNPNLRKALLNTSGLLVEASPSDTIWGIGLNESIANITPEAQWKGTNLLGKILTRVREDIKNGLVFDN